MCKSIIVTMDSRYEHTMLLVEAIASNKLSEVDHVIRTKRNIDLRLESSDFSAAEIGFPKVEMRFGYLSNPYIRRPTTVLGCAMLKGLPMYMRVYNLYTTHVKQRKILAYIKKRHIERDFDMMLRYADMDVFKTVTSHCCGNSYVMNYADSVHQLLESINFSKQEEQHKMVNDGLVYRRMQLAKVVVVKMYEGDFIDELIEKVKSVPQAQADGSLVMFANILSIYRGVFGDLLQIRYIDALNAIIEDEAHPLGRNELFAVALLKGVSLEWTRSD